MDTYGLELVGRQRRRRHSAEFKASVVAECSRPGVSIAAIALRHGLNANMLRKWVIESEGVGQRKRPVDPIVEPPAFVPLALAGPVSQQADIRIELQRAGTTATITWPVSATAELGSWLREWLR